MIILMAKKEKISGSEKFNTYYSELYGERWNSLKDAFSKESSPISLSDELSQAYYMDKASILAADVLPVKEGNKVLDMCAAPGGKTLVIALKLRGTGQLVSNDRSASRRNRLINVIQTCLPADWGKNIKVTGYDSSKWSLFEQNEYDCVLLDAPCSSERHVINDGKALEIWSPNRPKQLSIQQFAMLASALDAVKPNGYVLYSTCSINPIENELIIEKLEKKRSGRFEEVKTDVPGSEKLSHGQIFLPDKAEGTGPIYFCLIRKTE